MKFMTQTRFRDTVQPVYYWLLQDAVDEATAALINGPRWKYKNALKKVESIEKTYGIPRTAERNYFLGFEFRADAHESR